jgi:hypothetical protein
VGLLGPEKLAKEQTALETNSQAQRKQGTRIYSSKKHLKIK